MLESKNVTPATFATCYRLRGKTHVAKFVTHNEERRHTMTLMA